MPKVKGYDCNIISKKTATLRTMVKISPKVITVSRLFHGPRGLVCLNLIGFAQAYTAEGGGARIKQSV